jgi:hypothetical protein
LSSGRSLSESEVQCQKLLERHGSSWFFLVKLDSTWLDTDVKIKPSLLKSTPDVGFDHRLVEPAIYLEEEIHCPLLIIEG